MIHLGNNAVTVAPRASSFRIGGDINGTGMGNDTVSVSSGSTMFVIGGDFSGDDVGEEIHLSVLCVVM